ncbi:MAG: MoaD/ThiS family protein [Bacillota bacterium]
MAELYLPASLVDLFPGAPRRLTTEAPTVLALIQELDRRWPGMYDRLLEAGPAIREHLNIFVDGERATLATAIPPEGVVRIIPAVSGG